MISADLSLACKQPGTLVPVLSATSVSLMNGLSLRGPWGRRRLSGKEADGQEGEVACSKLYFKLVTRFVSVGIKLKIRNLGRSEQEQQASLNLLDE